MKSIRFFLLPTNDRSFREDDEVCCCCFYTYRAAVGLSSREYQSSASLELANHMAGLI